MNIVVSAGDCNGIGIEVFANSFKHNKFEGINFILVCNQLILEEYLKAVKIEYSIENDVINLFDKKIKLINCVTYTEIDYGIVSKGAGLHAVESLDKSIKLLFNKNADAILTLPIQKESMYLTGWQFAGHTEMLASRCNVDNEMMILGTKDLKVALATVHIPIKSVSSLLLDYKLKNKIISLNSCLKNDFGIENPKIAVLGLNPHAGENGNIGIEDVEIIEPLIKELKSTIEVSGPMPADGFFGFGKYKNYDGILAMYHDQGLIPLKMLANGGGVNYTANLPIIRVSPDHGTAYDIAGKNIANPQSTIESIELAIEVYKNRKSEK